MRRGKADSGSGMEYVRFIAAEVAVKVLVVAGAFRASGLRQSRAGRSRHSAADQIMTHSGGAPRHAKAAKNRTHSITAFPRIPVPRL